MNLNNHIAVICNYELKPERIGGMDRFFVAYDQACKDKGFTVNWFFSNCEPHSFYNNLKVFASKEISAEDLFLEHLNDSRAYDVVITHFVELCTPFFQNIKNSHKAYVIAVDHNPRPINGFPFKKRIKNKMKGMLYGSFIDSFVGVSRYTVDCIIKDYGQHLKEKTKLIYNGIDTSLYKVRNDENFGKMIVASHLRKSKGIQDLIEAIKLLPSEIKELVKIDIYGEGPMDFELKGKVQKYNLNRQIIFKGSSPVLPELLPQYSYLLQPTYMECFSLSLLESLAANVPVITTPVGGNLEIITHGENGFIFPAGDVEAIANILQNILQKEMTIENEVSSVIKKDFPLNKMVEEHIKLLPCT